MSKTATKEQVIQTISATLRGDYLLPPEFIDYVSRGNHATPQVDEQHLTDREKTIHQLIAIGYTNKAIATEMVLSQRTIEHQLTKLFTKLQVESRAEAVIKAKEQRLVY